MTSKNKKKYVEETVNIDTDLLYGDIDGAIAYLKKLSHEYKAKGFAKISLQEHWFGYEDMEIILNCQRKETDREHSIRLNAEKEEKNRLEEERKKKQEREEERAKDFEEFTRLKKMFS